MKPEITVRPARKTRIQRKNSDAILEAALDLFSQQGFRGTTLDAISGAAGLSKPNLLYYFPSKEAIYLALIGRMLESWLDPLRALDPAGEPVEEILAYVRRKLEMSRQFPRESRLFANEVLQGAPHIGGVLAGALAELVEEKAQLIARWSSEERIAVVHPKHLIFSIWAETQHYADFDVQVRAVLGPHESDPFPSAEAHLDLLFRKLLQP